MAVQYLLNTDPREALQSPRGLQKGWGFIESVGREIVWLLQLHD